MSAEDENENDMQDVADKVLAHAGDSILLRASMLAAFRLFYSKGHRAGYDDAMRDAKSGKDRRVAAHLN